MNWYILTTESRREFTVSYNIGTLHIPVFMPTDVKLKRLGRGVPAGAKRYSENPLLPTILFVQTYPETLDDLTTLRFVTGAYRNALGEALAIPDRQMVQFKDRYEEWFQRALKSVRAGEKIKRKPKKIKLGDLKDDPNMLASVMTELFGSEMESEAA